MDTRRRARPSPSVTRRGSYRVRGRGLGSRVRRAPLPVISRERHVRDLVVLMQLHVAITRGVLVPRRDNQVGLAPLPGFPAVHPRGMTAGAHVARFTLEIRKRCVISLTQRLINLGQQPGGQRLGVRVAVVPGPLHRGAETSVKDRDVLRPRNREIEIQRRLPGLPLRLDPQLRPPVIISTRLGGEQALVDLRRLPRVRRSPAELLPVRSLPLAE